MKKELKNPAASILARLRNVSKERKLDHTQTLTQFAIERFLYRLYLSDYRNRFLLKGAMLFVLWEDNPFRTTRDLDLLGFGEITVETAQEIFREIAKIKVPEDCLVFDPDSIDVNPIRAFEEYAGIRITMRAGIEKARISVQIDVGVGDSVTPEAEEVSFPTLLDLPAPKLRAYPMETVIAEKLHAVYKLGMLNTRMKDYYDLFHLITNYEFKGTQVYDAISATFSRRGNVPQTSTLIGLSSQFFLDETKKTQWNAFANKSKLILPRIELQEVASKINLFAEPVLNAIVEGEGFDQSWMPETQWS
ncbi:nucleotidyl transferase AbiEii/AbiGii toxin family protein [Oligoflexia bacterium]|nr:nucleotidyl transferase AbiEii/AbiGii toxin family protein [Oligoflexia bacterium]